MLEPEPVRQVLERIQVQDFLQRYNIGAQRLKRPDKEVELLVKDRLGPSEVLDVLGCYRDRHGICGLRWLIFACPGPNTQFDTLRM